MMTAKEKIQRASASVAFDGIFKYIKKNPAENLIKLINLSEKLIGNTFPAKNFEAFRKAVLDENNVWNRFAMNIINDVDPGVIKKMLLALGLGAGVNGTKAVRENREKYKCNIPFILLFIRKINVVHYYLSILTLSSKSLMICHSYPYIIPQNTKICKCFY